MRVLALRFVGFVSLVGVTGCAGASLVAARAADDMSCPEKDIKVTSREMGAYDARGCGKKLSYVVRGGEVLTDDGSDLAENKHGE
jgi:hypothetical protein